MPTQLTCYLPPWPSQNECFVLLLSGHVIVEATISDITLVYITQIRSVKVTAQPHMEH